MVGRDSWSSDLACNGINVSAWDQCVCSPEQEESGNQYREWHKMEYQAETLAYESSPLKGCVDVAMSRASTSAYCME